MARVLADGKTKFTILTTAPANPAAPTVSELDAGIDVSCDILTGDFTWTPTDSDPITDQKALCDKGNTTTFGASNFDTGLTLFREFGQEVQEKAWEALSEKGNEVWGYARETDKDSTEAWAADDEIYLGGKVVVDEPQRIDGEGFIRRRIPMGAQSMHTNIKVAEGTGGDGSGE